MGNPGPWLQAELPLCRGSPGHWQGMERIFPTDISRSLRSLEPGVGFILLGSSPAMESGCWASSPRHLAPFLLYLSVCLPRYVCASAQLCVFLCGCVCTFVCLHVCTSVSLHICAACAVGSGGGVDSLLPRLCTAGPRDQADLLTGPATRLAPLSRRSKKCVRVP